MARQPTSPLAVSLGDPAGIGPEVVAKCWDNRAPASGCRRSSRSATRSSLDAVWDGPIAAIDDPREADSAFDSGLPLLQLRSADAGMAGPSDASPARIARSTAWKSPSAWRGRVGAGAVVTGPVSKQQLYGIGFSHPGQTEFVAERCGVSSANVAMMLAGPTLRTVPVTTHMPLRATSPRS